MSEVTKCYKQFQEVTKSYKMLQNVTKSYKIFRRANLNIFKWSKIKQGKLKEPL